MEKSPVYGGLGIGYYNHNPDRSGNLTHFQDADIMENDVKNGLGYNLTVGTRIPSISSVAFNMELKYVYQRSEVVTALQRFTNHVKTFTITNNANFHSLFIYLNVSFNVLKI